MVSSSNTMTKENASEILEQMAKMIRDRDTAYGQAWLITGQVVQFIGSPFTDAVNDNGWMIYNWISILCKLIRALITPWNKDHWVDIIGYATLCVNHIERERAKEDAHQ